VFGMCEQADDERPLSQSVTFDLGDPDFPTVRTFDEKLDIIKE
jgi:hypothetical protein